MDNWIIGWLVFGIILIISELVIPGAILSFLGIAAMGVAALMHYGVIQGINQIAATFIGLSTFLLLIVRSLFLRLMPGESTVTDLDEAHEFEGAMVHVVEDIRPESPGRVKYRDSSWTAQSDSFIAAGQSAIIVKQIGNRLVVKSIL